MFPSIVDTHTCEPTLSIMHVRPPASSQAPITLQEYHLLDTQIRNGNLECLPIGNALHPRSLFSHHLPMANLSIGYFAVVSIVPSSNPLRIAIHFSHPYIYIYIVRRSSTPSIVYYPLCNLPWVVVLTSHVVFVIHICHH